MTKNEARKFFREKRKNLSYPDKQKLNDLILIQFQQLKLPFLGNVFSYLPMEDKNEVDPVPLVRYLQFTNPELVTAYPVCDFTDNSMQAVIADSDTIFVTNRFGASEPRGNRVISPQEIELVLTPLLSFDQQGYRAGYGKGFYDKFFMQAGPETLRIGLSYFEPIDKITDSDSFDVKLTHCITPHQVYEF